ncbi:MAG: flavodoxin family protein [Candidatus Helarchaeota archaeon]
MRAILIYHTVTGHTLQAIKNISEGLKSMEVECEIEKVPISNDINLSEFQIIVIGTPTHAFGPARKISNFIKKLPANSLNNMRVGIVICFAGMGGSRTLKTLKKKLIEKGAKEPIEEVEVKAGVPLSIVKGPEASEKDQKRCIEMGRKLGS